MNVIPITSGMYYDFNFPMTLMAFLGKVLRGRSHDPNTPEVARGTGVRQWFSQPRPGTDPSEEMLVVRFRLPLSVSEITVTALRVPCHITFEYQDRSNNWVEIRDTVQNRVELDLSGSEVVSFYRFHTKIHPIVAKAVRVIAKRRPDDLLGAQPYVIGLSELLLRRNVYDRSAGTQAFEDEQDVVGNVISKYLRDWDAPKAIDNNAHTFWKSQAFPDPAGVASMYCDVRDKLTGGPVSLSRVYIDPLYDGQQLNLYYSSDDTVGTRILSPITAVPSTDVDTEWRLGNGRRDISSGLDEAVYRWPMGLGPQLRQDMWFGIEWTPDFDADDAPPNNPVLLKVTPPAEIEGVFAPTIFYDGGAGMVVLDLDDGTDTVVSTAALNAAWAVGEPLRIVVGMRYAPDPEDLDEVFIKVTNGTGGVLAEDHADVALPDNISLDGQMGFNFFRGLMTATIVKLENYAGGSAAFLANPIVYTNPDPVAPDTNGVVPSTSLDGAVYASDWTAQQHGTGGNHDTAFADKEWTPIWKNYTTARGTLLLPQTISAKYLKCEFTNLTPEPYPIYDTGIEVSYAVFPVSVQQQASYGAQVYSQGGGFLGFNDLISINGIRTVNWLNPWSVKNAIQAVFGQTTQPVSIQTSPAIISATIPQNTGITNASRTYGIELGNSYIYRRDALNPYILAADQYNTIIKAEGLQAIQPFTTIPWDEIEATNSGAIQHRQTPGAVPIMGTDWWIFPGQTLKLSASLMEQLTSGRTVTKFHLDNRKRVRFQTTSVHRYEKRTLTRDKAIAYFAGLREIQPFTTTYVNGLDVASYEFTDYSSWSAINTVQGPNGPISTNGSPFVVPNASFLENVNRWEQREGDWYHDVQVGRFAGGGQGGCATATLSGDDPVELVSEIIPIPADYVPDGLTRDIVVGNWIRYFGLVAGTDPVIRLQVIPVDGTTESAPVDLIGLAEFTGREGRTDGRIFEQMIGTYEVPSDGVTGIKLLAHISGYTAGQIWVDEFSVSSDDWGEASLSKSFQTTSEFNMVHCDFRDSGLVRSDPMWADIDPLDNTNISDTALAYYVNTRPPNIPKGFWADSFANWADEDVSWGEPHAVVAVNIDGTLIYDGRRTLHFMRDAGQGEAGIEVRQQLNFIPESLARVCAIFRLQNDNDNEVTVRLRRVSDNAVIFEEVLTDAPTGFWYHYQSQFFEVPEGVDQVYRLEFTLTGDDADDAYLSDLYTEIANVRYFVLLGDSTPTNPYIDVTDLVYSGKETYVSTSNPVQTMAVQVAIKSPRAWAIGCSLTPNFLRT